MLLNAQTHPMGSTVDEVVPRSKGGSALERANCRHAHRLCQSIRGVKAVTPELRSAIRNELARRAKDRRRVLTQAW